MRIAAANKGQKVVNALMGSFIGSILVKSLVTAPSIQKGIDSNKTNRKNLIGEWLDLLQNSKRDILKGWLYI